MQDHTRRAVAFVVGVAVGRNPTAVYDYGSSSHFSFSGSRNGDAVRCYDYTLGCHISGTLSSLYHFGNRKHIQLAVDGTSFQGYDYDCGKHFSGSIRNGSISLYDYETSRHYNFSL